MFRGAHNVGLNQSPKSGISTTNLIGNFDPAIGVEQTGEIVMQGWLNQVENINLTHKNSIGGCHANVSPVCNDALKYFSFDGVDDFISGEVLNVYATSQTPFILSSVWTFASWVKGLSSDFVHILMTENNKSFYISLERISGVNYLKCRYSLDMSPVTNTLTIPSSIDITKWNQITITQSSNIARFFINGTYVGNLNCGFSSFTSYLLIGKYSYNSGNVTGYTNSGVKLGYVLIYNVEISNSTDRQNFNAVHGPTSSRRFGATYDA